MTRPHRTEVLHLMTAVHQPNLNNKRKPLILLQFSLKHVELWGHLEILMKPQCSFKNTACVLVKASCCGSLCTSRSWKTCERWNECSGVKAQDSNKEKSLHVKGAWRGWQSIYVCNPHAVKSHHNNEGNLPNLHTSSSSSYLWKSAEKPVFIPLTGPPCSAATHLNSSPRGAFKFPFL